MKVLLLILFAGYAVRCDENNYYVIEMLDETPQKPFKVYWNVPTKQCKSKKIPFQNLYEKFGIIQNENDAFRGEKITILYDPGLFPALLKNETSGRFKFRNGGVPQEGDLNKHLEAFSDELDQSIPDKDFNGLGIIDFESWRPVYRQNFGVLRPYKDVSLEIEKTLHWWWQKKRLIAEAKKRFEESARTFMQSTVAAARRLRPQARWGFYGFPYCFNMASNNMAESCADNVPGENDEMSWLWRESTTLFPSVYSSASLSSRQLAALVRGRVREAARFSHRILPYFWYRYRDAGFLSQVDLDAALDTLYNSKATGFIIWGSSNDVNTVEKCTKLLNYIEKVMGPAIAKYTKARRLQDGVDDISNITSTEGNIGTTISNSVATTTSPTTSDSTSKIDLDPEYHWIPPDNYTQAIKDHVEEEINKKHNKTENKDAVLDNNVLIDIILNSLINVEYNTENTSSTPSTVDSTYKIGPNNGSEFGESQSSTTEAFEVLEVGTTSDTSTVTDNEDKNLKKVYYVTSTESEKYETIPTEDATVVTTGMSSDDVTSISRSKNIKKSFVQNSRESLDLTTESSSSTEITATTEINNSKTVIQDYTTVQYDFTTENNLHDNEDTTRETATIAKSTESTTKGVFVTKIDDIITSTTETIDSTPTPSESTTHEALISTESDLGTALDLNINHITQNTSTIAPIFKENNETVLPDFKETRTSISLSTKAPDLNEIETTEKTQFGEGTSVMPTSNSPDQVVVYV